MLDRRAVSLCDPLQRVPFGRRGSRPLDGCSRLSRGRRTRDGVDGLSSDTRGVGAKADSPIFGSAPRHCVSVRYDTPLLTITLAVWHTPSVVALGPPSRGHHHTFSVYPHRLEGRASERSSERASLEIARTPSSILESGVG